MGRKVPTTLLAMLVLFLSACGGGSSPNNAGGSATFSAAPPASARAAATPIYVVMLENTSFGSVIGNPVMPFFNSLASRGALAGAYFGNTHPSLPNYFMLTTGQLVTGDDGFTGTVGADSIVRELGAAGRSWRAYLESIPSAGYLGDDVYPYVKHHNPFAYLSDVIANPAEAQNLRPFSDFAGDVAGGRSADFNFIVPNNLHNAHDCPDGPTECPLNAKLAATDAWLNANMGPLLSNAQFNQHGLLVIVFDEGDGGDMENSGGHIACVLVGPAVRPGFTSMTLFQHQSLLRLVLELLGAPNLPGAAAGATSMNEFLKAE